MRIEIIFNVVIAHSVHYLLCALNEAGVLWKEQYAVRNVKSVLVNTGGIKVDQII